MTSDESPDLVSPLPCGEVSDDQDRSPFSSSHHTLSTTTTVTNGNRRRHVQEPGDSGLRTWSQLQLFSFSQPWGMGAVPALVLQMERLSFPEVK